MYITKKKIGKYEYYYLRKSERRNGKVTAVNVAYLGKDKAEAELKAKEIISKLDGRIEKLMLEVGVVRGSTREAVLSKEFNLYMGISLNNKWFTKDNIREYIRWGLEHTKEKFGIVIADTLQAINYQHKDNFSRQASLRKALDYGDKFVKLLEELILELPSNLQTKIDVVRWDDLTKTSGFDIAYKVFLKEYENNAVFKSEIIELVRGFMKSSGRNFSEKRLSNLGLYVISEMPELLNGFHYNGTYYNGLIYPLDNSLARLTEKIQKRKMFAHFHDITEIKNNVFIELGGKERINKPEKREDKKIWDKTMVDENSKEKDSEKEKEFVSFVQEAGLIWGPEPEIYGGMAGFYTYGPLGKLLKNRVENSVRKVFNSHGLREMEGPTVMPDVVWKASGHLGTFADRIIKCKKCKSVFRADKLIEEKFDVSADSFSDDKILKFIEEKGIKCPSCSGGFEMHIEKQSLMMKTKVAGTDASLRPETATVTYLPFLRALNYFRKKIPFGVYQIGKAYRNEISPRQSVLRGREFTQAEGQLFVDPFMKNNWDKFADIKDEKLPLWNWEKQKQGNEGRKEELANNHKEGFWDGGSGISLGNAIHKGMIKSQAYAWCLWLAYTQFRNFGIPVERIRIRQHWPDEKAFYADDAWDIEIKTNNYGWVEVCGVHDRTDYDLKQHSKESGVALEAIREDGSRFTPHILEIAFGTDRPTYVLMDLFYEKKMEGEGKTTFKVPYNMAPIDVSIFPLMKKPELTKLAKEIKNDLEKEFVIDYDESSSIGKRYLRAATAGTPFAITIDFDSLIKHDVTIRDRDSEKQIRVKIAGLKEKLRDLLSGKEKI